MVDAKPAPTVNVRLRIHTKTKAATEERLLGFPATCTVFYPATIGDLATERYSGCDQLDAVFFVDVRAASNISTPPSSIKSSARASGSGLGFLRFNATSLELEDSTASRKARLPTKMNALRGDITNHRLKSQTRSVPGPIPG